MNGDYIMLMAVCGFCPSITAVVKMKILYFIVKSYSSLLLMSLLGFGSKKHQNLQYFTIFRNGTSLLEFGLIFPLIYYSLDRNV